MLLEYELFLKAFHGKSWPLLKHPYGSGPRTPMTKSQHLFPPVQACFALPKPNKAPNKHRSQIAPPYFWSTSERTPIR